MGEENGRQRQVPAQKRKAQKKDGTSIVTNSGSRSIADSVVYFWVLGYTVKLRKEMVNGGENSLLSFPETMTWGLALA